MFHIHNVQIMKEWITYTLKSLVSFWSLGNNSRHSLTIIMLDQEKIISEKRNCNISKKKLLKCILVTARNIHLFWSYAICVKDIVLIKRVITEEDILSARYQRLNACLKFVCYICQ